ncbi:PREDICTED: uncharacterized protein LOC109470551 [Branchiostoma belcheri]|uniref:Uncharacterized protein LOC109470551 n=1 Tax=Branchiostoma belcheri TaxID=7741 RepID=A0A6P4YTJ4_BRABE|nr:PREDICTED: uncharacterized protein LOC109470551 [Branchiostoma belcheri]
MDVYNIDYVTLNDSVAKMRLREKLLAEQGVQLPKAPSKAQREAAVAAAAAVPVPLAVAAAAVVAPVPLAVSEGDVAKRQGPLSQPGKKDTSASEPTLAECVEVPSSVPNKGTSAPTVQREETDGNRLVNKEEENLLISKDEENLLVSKDEENLLVSKDEENLLINNDEENPLINKDEENPLINKDEEENKLINSEEKNRLINNDDENLELAVQHLCCTAIRDACKELQEDLEESLSKEEEDGKEEKLVSTTPRQYGGKMRLDRENADERERWLVKTPEILARNAIEGAFKVLRGEMEPSCDTLSGQNIHLQYMSIRDAVTGCDENDQATQQPLHQEKPSIEEEALECGIEHKVTEREEKMENFHEEENNIIEEKEQTQPKTKKGWKARGKGAARRLGRAVRRLLTSCFRCRVAP